MKIQNLYLLLAAACSVMLCFFSPVYFSSEEDAMHYFTMDFASINARTYDANNQLVVDESFTYATTDDNGQVLSTKQGASIMSIARVGYSDGGIGALDARVGHPRDQTQGPRDFGASIHPAYFWRVGLLRYARHVRVLLHRSL